MNIQPEETSRYTAWWDATRCRLHREDGPAVTYKEGAAGGLAGQQEWFVNGTRHRLDGPAVVKPDGDNSWYVNGQYLANEQVFLDFLDLNGLSPVGKPVELEL